MNDTEQLRTLGEGADAPESIFARPSPASPLASPRGTTRIAPGVAEKIGQRAAAEVPGIRGVRQSGLRRLLAPVTSSGNSADTVDARAEVDRETAIIDLEISVQYPQSAADAADRVREHVMSRVQEMTGLEVVEVNITISHLAVDESRPQRRVQ